MEKFMTYFFLGILGFVAVVFVAILFCFPLMWCWNFVMPYLFGFKVITWQQAWCLSFVFGILIKPSMSSK